MSATPGLPARRVLAGVRRAGALIAVAAAGAAIALGVQALVTGRNPLAPGPARLEGTVTSRLTWPAWALAFSPDGMSLAAGGVRSTSVYNLATGQRTAVLPAGNAGITSLAFSPDGRTLTVTTDGSGIQMWDLAARRLEPRLRHPRNYGFYSASYSPDGKFLAASDNAGTSSYVWDVRTRRPVAVLAFPDAGVSPVAFSPDGRTLAIADGDLTGQGRHYGNIHLWSTATRTVTGKLHDPDGLQTFATVWSPDGKMLAAADPRRIYLWNTATRTIATTIRAPRNVTLSDMDFSPAGRWLAATIAGGESALIWDIRTGRLVATLQSPDSGEVASLAYSPDGRSLAVGEYNGRIYLWNVSRLS